MKFVSTILMFFGYLLIYAATAAGGKFATEPWAGLFADAYTESTDPNITTRGDVGPPSDRPFIVPFAPIGPAPSTNPFRPGSTPRRNAEFNAGFQDAYGGAGPQPAPPGSPYMAGYAAGQRARNGTGLPKSTGNAPRIRAGGSPF